MRVKAGVQCPQGNYMGDGCVRSQEVVAIIEHQIRDP